METTDYTQYYYLYNFIQIAIIIPFCLILLHIAAASVQHHYNFTQSQRILYKHKMSMLSHANREQQGFNRLMQERNGGGQTVTAPLKRPVMKNSLSEPFVPTEARHLSTGVDGGHVADIENTMTLENTVVTHEQHPHITDDYDHDNMNMNMYDDNEYNNDYNDNMDDDAVGGAGAAGAAGAAGDDGNEYQNDYQFSAMPLATAQPLTQKDVTAKTDGTHGLYSNNPNEMREMKQRGQGGSGGGRRERASDSNEDQDDDDDDSQNGASDSSNGSSQDANDWHRRSTSLSQATISSQRRSASKVAFLQSINQSYQESQNMQEKQKLMTAQMILQQQRQPQSRFSNLRQSMKKSKHQRTGSQLSQLSSQLSPFSSKRRLQSLQASQPLRSVQSLNALEQSPRSDNEMGFNSFDYENDRKDNGRNNRNNNNNNNNNGGREIMTPANTNKTSNVTNMTFSHIDNIGGLPRESSESFDSENESVFNDAQGLIRVDAMNVGYDQDELHSQLWSHQQLTGFAATFLAYENARNQQQQQQLPQGGDATNDTRLDLNDDNLRSHSIEINDINSMSPNSPNSRRSDKLMSISSRHKKNNSNKSNSALKTKNRNKNKNKIKNKALAISNNKQIYHTTHKTNANANDSITPGGPGVTPGGGRDGGITKGGVGSGGQRVISCKLLTKKVLIFIGFNPIIIAVVGAFVARIFLTQNSLNWLQEVLSPITNIYQFLSLFVIGLVICILYTQRRNIFDFAILNHKRKKRLIINQFENANKHRPTHTPSNGGPGVIDHGPSVLTVTAEDDRKSQIRLNSGDISTLAQQNNNYLTSKSTKLLNAQSDSAILEKPGIIDQSVTSIPTSSGPSGNNNNNNNKNGVTQRVYSIDSFSLLNTDSVMIYVWAFAFVLLKYSFASIIFYFIAETIYRFDFFHRSNGGDNTFAEIQREMNALNYLYGTLPSNLLALVLAMKYNIYISFIMISYLISMLIYPLVSFVGLILVTVVQINALRSAIHVLTYACQVFAMVASVFVIIFWLGYRHWKTLPITIFICILVFDSVYNIGYFVCEYLNVRQDGDSDELVYTQGFSPQVVFFVYFSTYFLRHYIRLLLITAAFQTALMISSYEMTKSRLFKLQIRMQIFNVLFSLVVSLFVWYFDVTTYKFNFYWTEFASKKNAAFDDFFTAKYITCVFANTSQIYVDLCINSIEFFILIGLLFVILRQKYKYESELLKHGSHNRRHGAGSTLFITCYERWCYILSCQWICMLPCWANEYPCDKICSHRESESTNATLNTKKNGKTVEQMLNSPLLKHRDNDIDGNEMAIALQSVDRGANNRLDNENDRNGTPNQSIVHESRIDSGVRHESRHASRATSFSQYRFDSGNGTYQLDDNLITNEAGLPRVMMIDSKPVRIDPNYTDKPRQMNINDNEAMHLSVVDDGKNDDYRRLTTNREEMTLSLSLNSIYTAMIATDPSSIKSYYQFDYYGYCLIIYCAILLAFLCNILFLLYLIYAQHHYKYNSSSDDNNDNNDSKDDHVLELMLLTSVFEEGSTFLIAVLFLTTKPVKRLAKNFFIRFRLHMRKKRNKYGDDGNRRDAGSSDSDKEDNESDDSSDDDKGNGSGKKKKRAVYKNIDRFGFRNVNLTRSFFYKLPVLW